jgi:hypothetical protein
MGQVNVGVIENFVVGYLLSFGAISTAIIFYCLYRTCKVMCAGADRVVKRRLLVIAGVFLLTALTNNSLITKTPALYILIVGLWCASRITRQGHYRLSCQALPTVPDNEDA